jgi:N-acetylneuraminic acid mutarotase
VPNATNMPGARYQTSGWTLDNSLYLLGGIGEPGSGLKNDLWEYNTITKNWTWLKGAEISNQLGIYGTQGIEAPTNVPGARRSYSTWVLNNKLYLFGGYGAGNAGFGQLNDLWIFDPTTTNWTWLKGSKGIQGGIYGTKGTSDANNTPGGREGAISWVANNKLYLLGGNGYGGNNLLSLLNDLWEYDPTTNNWKWISGSNIGGAEGNFGTKGVAAASNEPGCRKNAVAWAFNNKIYLMGGRGKAVGASINYLNDFWQYDLSTNLWTWLKGGNSTGVSGGVYGQLGVEDPNNTPGPRENHIAWTNNGKFYLYGGFGRVLGSIAPGFLSDLWEYNPSNNNWTWISGQMDVDIPAVYGAKDVFSSNNYPGMRYQSVGWAMNNYLYLFGGFDFNTLNNYNDLWKIFLNCGKMYSLKSDNWNSNTTWSCGRVPIISDDIYIYGHTIDLTGNGYAKSVIYNSTGTVRLGVGGNLILNP